MYNIMVKKSMSPTIQAWLRDAAEQLANAGIASALLDAEIILAHTLHKSRTWLHAHNDDELSSRLVEIADARLVLRLDRIPIAYIIGHKEFYSRIFTVTPSVLIPRPESESIIELLKKHVPAGATRLIDVGTGSGCLGITAKLELPQLTVALSDISRHALKIAQRNAANLHADVVTTQSNLLANVADHYDVVLANLPYVDTTWERSPETNHEPGLALFADNGGLALINELIKQLPDVLIAPGLVVLEADPEQHAVIITAAKTIGLEHVETDDYAIAFKKN